MEDGRQYGQGMVRPGCWWSPERNLGGYVDRQYPVARSVAALHTDIATCWSEHVADAARFAALFVSTSATLSIGTSAALDVGYTSAPVWVTEARSDA